MATEPFVSVYVGLSLDGFIARPDGNVDWLEPEGEFIEPEGAVTFAAFMDRVDALLMGRNTLDFVAGSGQWHYGKTPVYVATHRPLPTIAGADIRPLEGTPKEMVAELAAQGIRRIYLDGGHLVQQFLAANLVDELVLTRLPITIGTGISLFSPDADDARWAHERTHANQTYVQSVYRRLVQGP